MTEDEAEEALAEALRLHLAARVCGDEVVAQAYEERSSLMEREAMAVLIPLREPALKEAKRLKREWWERLPPTPGRPRTYQ